MPGIDLSSAGRRQRMLLAVLAVVGQVLCVANYSIWWLGFVAWIPMFASIEGARPRAALFYGWLTGLLTVFWGFFWLTELLVKFAGFSKIVSSPVALLFASYHGLLWGFAMMLTAWMRRRTRLPLMLVAPLSWVAIEATLPNIFPIYQAQGWAAAPLWIQTAEIGGITMVTGLMVAINAGLYTLLKGWLTNKTFERKTAIATAALLIGIPSYGAVRMAQVRADMEAAPKLGVGIVQGNMSIREMAVRQHRPRILREQQRVSGELEAKGAEVVIWGETAYPNAHMFHRKSVHEPPAGHRWRLHEGFSIPAVVGAVSREKLGVRGCGVKAKCWNTAYLIDGDGTIKGSYDKVYRLIFGEYIPVIDPEWYLSMVPSASHLEQGAGPQVLPLGEYRLGAFICYEDILPRYVRETANEGVHAFFNLTNDAWFGKTHEPGQHLGLAVFRSVEHRKPIVRAVNTGISAYIDPLGQVVERTELTDPDIDGPQKAVGLKVDIPMMDPDHRSIYGLTGETFNVLCILGLIVLGIRFKVPPEATAAAAEPSKSSKPADPSDEKSAPETDKAEGSATADAKDDDADPEPAPTS